MFLISLNLTFAQSAGICNDIDDFFPNTPFDTAYFEGQVTAYDDAIADTPNDAELHALRGDAYYALRQFDDAKQDYETAIELDSTYAYAYARLGDTYQQVFDLEPALQSYTKAISINLNYAYPYVKRGVLYRKLGDARNRGPAGAEYVQALQDMNTAIELDPTLVLALARRSELHLVMENYPMAIEDGQRAIELNPLDPFAYVVSGNVSIFTQDYPDAILLLNNALQLETEQVSTYAYAYSARANLCRRVGNILQARRDAQHALDIDPSYSWAYFESASIAIFDLSYGIAIDYLLQSLEYNPLDPNIYDLLEFYGVDEDQYADSLRIFYSWIEYQPERNLTQPF